MLVMIVSITTGITGNHVWAEKSIIPQLNWNEFALIIFGIILVVSIIAKLVN